MMSAETKVDLEIELLTSNTVIEPVFHPNGGVADFNLVIDGNTSLASTVYTDEKLAAMLEKWCSLTGQTPAHRLVNKAEVTIYRSRTESRNHIVWKTKTSLKHWKRLPN